MDPVEADVYDCSSASSPNDCASIIAQARDIVGSGKNGAGGQDIDIDASDVIIGQAPRIRLAGAGFKSP